MLIQFDPILRGPEDVDQSTVTTSKSAPKKPTPQAKADAPDTKSLATRRTYNSRLVKQAKGEVPPPKAKVDKKGHITNPVEAGLRERASMRKTSSGQIAAGPDDPKYTPITPLVRTAFLAALATRGMPTVVARELRIHYLSLRVLYREDKEFKEAWDEAMGAAFAHHEDAVRIRAFEGYERPVYQQGMKVGTETVYSDRLAEIMIKAGKPETYNPKTVQTIEHAGQVGVAFSHLSDDELNAEINKRLRFLGALPPNTGDPVEPDDVVDPKELNKSAGDFT